jgi:hypothetical protein
MKSAILYSTTINQGDPGQVRVPVMEDFNTMSSEAVYVRAVIFDGPIWEALDKAGDFQRPGETVLNTIPLTDSGDTSEQAREDKSAAYVTARESRVKEANGVAANLSHQEWFKYEHGLMLQQWAESGEVDFGKLKGVKTKEEFYSFAPVPVIIKGSNETTPI